MTKVLIVTVEPPWPPIHGGRLRTARVAEAMRRYVDVEVAYPDEGLATEPGPVPCLPLSWRAPSRLRTRATLLPHLGAYYVLPMLRSLVAVVRDRRPDVIYWSHSYLAAWAPSELRATPSVVEFANVEAQRLRTLAASARGLRRAARGAEAMKASHWEPRVARSADVCVALSEPDQSLLATWGATVVLAPNGVDVVPYQSSPADGYVLAMASYYYEPNVTATRRLVHEVWPEVVARHPAAKLVVAGRASEALKGEFEAVTGVTVAGTVADVTEVYAGAAVAVAPATTGGGSQLKLTEALSRGRCVVTTPFGAAGLPGALSGTCGYRVAAVGPEFAQAIVDALTDPAARHARERDAWQRSQALGWPLTVQPAIEAVRRLAERGVLA
jgi:glycosyltransferase involved in cell wall biosynthesis